MSALVVRLPTAAPRKVKNPLTRAGRAASEQLPQFPCRRALWPEQRKAVNSAKLILGMERTPELAIVTAIFQVMSPIDRLKVQAFVAMLAIKDGDSGLRALEWLKVLDGNATTSVNHAVKKLTSGEWE